MTTRATPGQVFASFRNVRTLWITHTKNRKAVELQIDTLLTADEKPADYARQIELQRERLMCWNGKLTVLHVNAFTRSIY